MTPERIAIERILHENPRDEFMHRVYADMLTEFGEDLLAEHHRLWTPAWQDSCEYLVQFARDITETESDAVSVEEVIQAAERFLETGETACLSGMGFAAENDLGEPGALETFWQHYVTYTRKPLPRPVTEVDSPFRCDC